MTNARPDRSRYLEAGVDISAGNDLVEHLKPIARSTARPGADAGLGGFGGVFDLASLGIEDPLLVAATDGVGTKILLAIDADDLDTIGVDLVAMCVNDLVVQGAEPLFFLDYLATGRLESRQALRVVEGIAFGCREAGCALIGGETAEMPGLYARGHFDLAGFCVGVVSRPSLLPRSDVRIGDRLIGLPSSGIHSNGYSLVRKIVAETGLALDGPAPFETGTTLSRALLRPTRIYVRSCLAAIRAGGIKALAHITGGGLAENVPRVLPPGVDAEIDLGRFALPPVFQWLARTGRLGFADLSRTFNSGIGMVICAEAERTSAVMRVLESMGEEPVEIGAIVEGATGAPPRVRLEGVENAWPEPASPS